MTVPGRRPRAAATALALLAAAGCGIRSTPVPVDAGAAPSRASCGSVTEPADPSADSGTGTADIFLVCRGRVVSVSRSIPVPRSGDVTERLALARALLKQLQTEPGRAETDAGFSTDVRAGLRVNGPRRGDPEGTLRLNRMPHELPGFTLAQLVCTYAGTAAATGSGRTVVLGGPADGDRPVRRYECGMALRTDPKAAHTAGTPG